MRIWIAVVTQVAEKWDIQTDIPRIFGLCAEAKRAVSRVLTAQRRRSRP